MRAQGRQLQNETLQKYNQVSIIVDLIIQDHPEKYKRIANEAKNTILPILEQDGLTWMKSTDEALEQVNKAIDEQIVQLENCPSKYEDKVLLVPDTNAIISNTDIERWKFDEFTQFTLVMTPQVLSELDNLKISHRSENV